MNKNNWFKNAVILVCIALIVLFILASLLLLELSMIFGSVISILVIIVTDILVGYVGVQLANLFDKNNEKKE